MDYEACRQGYCNIIAGSCLALGMLFAGTADASACHVLSYYVRCFRAIRLQHRDSFNAANSATHPSRLHYLDRHTCETCLLSCMLALAMVMAGSGDLATLRLFLSLHQRVDERHTVGRQQGFFMAIGLLFLGGGEWSLKRGREGAVGLLLSMFPFFGGGAGTNENRLYLQALRHLYTLSAECRAMKAVEVDSGKGELLQAAGADEGGRPSAAADHSLPPPARRPHRQRPHRRHRLLAHRRHLLLQLKPSHVLDLHFPPVHILPPTSSTSNAARRTCCGSWTRHRLWS